MKQQRKKEGKKEKVVFLQSVALVGGLGKDQGPGSPFHPLEGNGDT